MPGSAGLPVSTRNSAVSCVGSFTGSTFGGGSRYARPSAGPAPLPPALGSASSSAPAIDSRMRARSTTPTSRPSSTTRIGFSVAAAAWSAARMIVSGGKTGPSAASSGVRVAHDPAERQHVALGDVADEVGDVVVGRRPDQLLRPAGLDDRPVAHDQDVVAELQRLGEVVGDEDHRLADFVVEPEDLVLHVPPDQRVERAERLVEEHHLGVDRERPGEADALLLAARQLVGVAVRVALEADERQHPPGDGEPIRLGVAADLEPERDVVEDRAGGAAGRSAGRPSRSAAAGARGASPGRPSGCRRRRGGSGRTSARSAG